MCFTATSPDSTQVPTDIPTTSPTVNPDLDPLPTSTLSTSISHPVFAPPSRNTIDLQHKADLGVVSSIPLSSPLVLVPSNTLPANPLLSLASPASRVDQVTPSLGLVPSTLITAISPAPSPGTSVSHPNMAPNDGTFDNSRDSRTPDISNTVETPQWSHQLAMSIPDIVANISRHSLCSGPPSRDIDRLSIDENID
jgi:hypothetical protein